LGLPVPAERRLARFLGRQGCIGTTEYDCGEICCGKVYYRESSKGEDTKFFIPDEWGRTRPGKGMHRNGTLKGWLLNGVWFENIDFLLKWMH
jgi:hypothetical protein